MFTVKYASGSYSLGSELLSSKSLTSILMSSSVCQRVGAPRCAKLCVMCAGHRRSPLQKNLLEYLIRLLVVDPAFLLKFRLVNPALFSEPLLISLALLVHPLQHEERSATASILHFTSVANSKSDKRSVMD